VISASKSSPRGDGVIMVASSAANLIAFVTLASIRIAMRRLAR
jgi:hypothetical protein